MATGHGAGPPFRWVSGVYVLGLIPGLLLVPRPANASDPAPLLGARLVYERSAGSNLCPDERGARSALTAQLGPGSLEPAASGSLSPAASGSSSRRIRLKVGPRPGPEHEIEGHIELQEADGKAVWANDLFAAHDDCATLIASLALSLRIAVDGLSRPSVASTSPSGAAPEAPPIIVRGVSYLPPPFVPMAPSLFLSRRAFPGIEDEDPFGQPSLSIWVGVAPLFGAAPTVPVRLSLSIGLAWPSVSVSAEFRGVLPAGGQVGAYHLEVTRWEGAFLPCVHKMSFFGCAILSVGGVSGRIEGAYEETVGFVRAGCGMRGGYLIPISRSLSLAIHGDVEVSPSPARIAIDSFAVWSESLVQGAVALAIAGSFPASPY